jgi:hypothetical protein
LNKKVWIKPEVRVLIRNNEHESVLCTCKNNSAYMGGPGNSHCHATGNAPHIGCSNAIDS